MCVCVHIVSACVQEGGLARRDSFTSRGRQLTRQASKTGTVHLSTLNSQLTYTHTASPQIRVEIKSMYLGMI